jgi:hypothetical protein
LTSEAKNHRWIAFQTGQVNVFVAFTAAPVCAAGQPVLSGLQLSLTQPHAVPAFLCYGLLLHGVHAGEAAHTSLVKGDGARVLRNLRQSLGQLVQFLSDPLSKRFK